MYLYQKVYFVQCPFKHLLCFKIIVTQKLNRGHREAAPNMNKSLDQFISTGVFYIKKRTDEIHISFFAG